VELPAGSYTISGSVYFGNATAPQCTIWHTTGPGSASGRSSFGVATRTQFTLAVSDAFTAAAPTTLYVECSGGGTSAISPLVIATQVETLHQ